MDKFQALHAFWSGFGLKAYDQYAVPHDAKFPYITYEAQGDSFGNTVAMTASLWYRGESWESATKKAEEIGEYLSGLPFPVNIDNGLVWFKAGTPFAQRMNDPDDEKIRRIVLNIEVDYLTKF